MLTDLLIYGFDANAEIGKSKYSFDFDYFRKLTDRFTEEVKYKVAKFAQIFKLTGGTSTIPNWRLKQMLLTAGFGAFAPYKDGKLYFLLGGLGGERNYYYMPTKFVFSNPHMPNRETWSGELEIGDECVVAKSDLMYMGIAPILTKHTTTQIQTDLSAYLATISSRLVNVGVAGRDNEKIALDAAIADVERGRLKTVVDKNVMQKLNTIPYGGNANILKDYIEYLQYDKAAEANELGLSANWNAKRESLSSAETLLNDDATHPYVDGMYECWQEWIKEVNETYGDLLDNGEYKLEWASSWEVSAKETEHSIETLEEPPTEEAPAAGEPTEEKGDDNEQAN